MGDLFHVPERHRIHDHPTMGSSAADGNNGAFDLDSVEPGWRLLIIASDGTHLAIARGWEHVSVQAYRGRQSRIPTWREMAFVKDQFWDGDAVVMQLHPRRSEYVNVHPNVLHLWRHTTIPIPTPPPILVGPLIHG